MNIFPYPQPKGFPVSEQCRTVGNNIVKDNAHETNCLSVLRTV